MNIKSLEETCHTINSGRARAGKETGIQAGEKARGDFPACSVDTCVVWIISHQKCVCASPGLLNIFFFT